MAETRRLRTELSERIDILNEMLSALVELLEDKGILSYDEWEERIEGRLVRSVEQEVYKRIVTRLRGILGKGEQIEAHYPRRP